MMLLILVSFLLTGAVAFFVFKDKNEAYHQDRLKRKEYAVIESIDYHLRENADMSQDVDSLVKMFDNEICELADIHNLDINIYSLKGERLITSNPTLYETGMLREILSSSLVDSLRSKDREIVERIKSDSVNYLSSYDFIRDLNNQPVAIINLPYFDSTEVHKKDLLAFLTRLGVVYLLLFLISMLVAFLLANYISRKLRDLGQKMKSVSIRKTNAKVEGRFDAEIASLVAEYNRMLAELEKSAVKLAQTERESAWKEMAKQVAHEIKNPLTPMRLNVQRLQAQGAKLSPERLDELCEAMLHQIDALGGIADAFSRFATMPKLHKEKFAVQQLIQRVTALYPQHQIEFVCDNPNATIEVDKDQMVRVMNNLLTNAFQAIPEGIKPEVKVQVENDEDKVLIRVSDNGQGIEQEQLAKVFEPRFTTKTSGMGLGLSMVKNIIEGFDGEIQLQSKWGQGSTFTIVLPRIK